MPVAILEPERKTLIRKIENVFANVKPPKTLSIPGSEAALQGLAGKQRNELTAELVKAHRDFRAFSDEAFKYYLPGYFVVMLAHPEQVKDIDLIVALARHLGRDYDPPLPRDLCPQFDKYQKAVIAAFLDMVEPLWLPEHDIDVKTALAKPAKRVQARRDLIKERDGWMKVVNKARFYWGLCQSTIT